MDLKLEGDISRVFVIRKSVNLFVLCDHMMFPRRSSVRMSRCGFRSEDILFMEGLSYLVPPGTAGEPRGGWFDIPCLHGRSKTPLTGGAKDCAAVVSVCPMVDLWLCWIFHWSGTSTEWSIPSICRLEVSWERRSKALASCKEAAPNVGLKRSREFREETSTSLHHRPVSRSG